MHILWMRCLLRACGGLLGGLLAASVIAQEYPSRPIRLVLPFAPAGSTDVIGRAVGQKLGEALKQPVIIDNRPGAGGTVGYQFVSKAPADGHTLLMSGSVMAIYSVFGSELPFDPITEFTPVGTLADIPLGIFAGSATPFRTLADLVAAAKAGPGKYSYGSPGVGTSAHLACEILLFRAGIQIVHVPYKGNAPSVSDLLGGQIPLLCSSLAGVLPNIKAGKMRALAVTGISRAAPVPEVMTFREAGIASLDNGTWMGFVAQVQTPQAIITRLNTELNRSLKAPDLTERFDAAGAVALISTPQEYAQRLQRLREDLDEFRKRTGFRLQ